MSWVISACATTSWERTDASSSSFEVAVVKVAAVSFWGTAWLEDAFVADEALAGSGIVLETEEGASLAVELGVESAATLARREAGRMDEAGDGRVDGVLGVGWTSTELMES